MTNSKPKVRFYKLAINAITPEYAHADDSGADVFCMEQITLLPGQTKLVGTGISVELPEGWELQVRSKSGLAFKKGLIVLNSPGTIDESYRLEIKVILHNVSTETVTLEANSKIAQLVLAPVYQANFVLMDSAQRSGGFGSTGLSSKSNPTGSKPTVDYPNKPQKEAIKVSTDEGFVAGTLSLGS